MSTIRLRLPESLHRQARELAEQEGISINQLIATSLAEKLSALMTSDYLEARAKRGSVRAFQRVLKKVKDRTPVAGEIRRELRRHEHARHAATAQLTFDRVVRAESLQALL